MPAAIRDFVIEQGATFTQRIVWKDANNVPVNLTGYTARMQSRRTRTSPDVLVELTTENGRITISGSTGAITLTIPASVTNAFDWTRGLYDLELIKPNNDVVRLLQGTLTVSVGMTR